MAEQRRPFEKFVDSPKSELCGGAVTAGDALLITLHPLLENVLQTVCRKLQEDSGTGVIFASELPFRGWKSPEIAWGEMWTSQAGWMSCKVF
jgi:hypothetical protein